MFTLHQLEAAEAVGWRICLLLHRMPFAIKWGYVMKNRRRRLLCISQISCRAF